MRIPSSGNSDMTSEGLGELFEGDSADTCTGPHRREWKLSKLPDESEVAWPFIHGSSFGL